MTTGYLNAIDAAALDAELMSTPGFSLEQLMELAGLAVAEAIYQGIPAGCTDKRKILFVCGPGNNGGDGLVAARHLYFFRHYDCVIVYPKRSKNPHFLNLVKQCEDINIPILDKMPADIDSYDGIIDAIFGFSFKGEPRAPFASILFQIIAVQQQQQQQQQQQNPPVVSFGNHRMSLMGQLQQNPNQRMSLMGRMSEVSYGRAMSGLSALSIDWENMDDFDVNVDHSEHINNSIGAAAAAAVAATGAMGRGNRGTRVASRSSMRHPSIQSGTDNDAHVQFRL